MGAPLGTPAHFWIPFNLGSSFTTLDSAPQTKITWTLTKLWKGCRGFVLGPAPLQAPQRAALGGSVTASWVSLLLGPSNPPALDASQGDTIPPPGKKPDARPGALPLGEANMCSAWLPIWPLSTWPVPTLLKPPGHKKEPEGACACPWPDTLCIQSTLPVRPLVACPLETPSCPPFSLWPPQISFTSSQRPGAVGPLKLSFFRPRPGAELSRVSELFL